PQVIGQYVHLFIWRFSHPMLWQLRRSERQRGVSVQVERRVNAGSKSSEAGSRDHGGIVGGQRQAWEKRRQLALIAVQCQLLAKPAVRRDAARDSEADGLISADGGRGALDERRHHNSLEAGADVGDLALRKNRTRGSCSGPAVHVAQDRRLEPAKA